MLRYYDRFFMLSYYHFIKSGEDDKSSARKSSVLFLSVIILLHIFASQVIIKFCFNFIDLFFVLDLGTGEEWIFITIFFGFSFLLGKVYSEKRLYELLKKKKPKGKIWIDFFLNVLAVAGVLAIYIYFE